MSDTTNPRRTPAEDRRPYELDVDLETDTNEGRRTRRRRQVREWARDAGMREDDLVAVELGGPRPRCWVLERDPVTDQVVVEDGARRSLVRVLVDDAAEDDAADYLFGGRPRRRPRQRRPRSGSPEANRRL
ncbi:MAG: hypothetical protein AAGA99_22385 [Actinomycetota bacterium]